MDVEEIIKRVADEVYAKIREEEASSTGRSVSGSNSGEEWILSKMNTSMSFEEMKRACDSVKSSKAKTICLPQWFLNDASAALKGSGKKLATIVGLPGGTTSSFAKYAEAKQAVVAGADVVMIPVNMTECALGEWGTAKNDLAESMVPCKGKAAVYALLEVDSLSCDQLATTAEMCASCGVDKIMLSAVVGGSVSDQQIQAVKKAGACVGVYGGVSNSNVGEYQRAGASCFASSQC